MEKWQIVVLTAVLSLFTGIITAVVTSFVHHKNDIKIKIYDLRKDLYFECYEKIDESINLSDLVFDGDFIEFVDKYKPRIKLLSSQKTFSAYQNYYNFIHEKKFEYDEFCSKENPYNNPDLCYTDYADGEEIEQCFVTPEHEADFANAQLNYKEQNMPSIDEMQKFIMPLYEAMRKDLGGNLK